MFKHCGKFCEGGTFICLRTRRCFVMVGHIGWYFQDKRDVSKGGGSEMLGKAGALRRCEE